MTPYQELIMVLQAVMAAILGCLVGWEREHDKKYQHAGLRTFGTLALGSCVFGLISLHTPGFTDSSRIAAQIVTGVGFIGAGVIFKEGFNVEGLTTAASLWSVAAIGLAVAFELYIISILTTMLMVFLLALPRFTWWRYISPKYQIRKASKDKV